MKKLSFVLIALLVLVTAAISPDRILAAADAACASDPSAGPVGTVFVITCSGYTPGTHVYAYLVEPAGVATTLFDETGSLKVGADGSITYAQQSKFGNTSSLATGTWGFVAEELGLGHSVLHRGQTTFRVTGGTEGVSGAELTADPTSINKPETAYLSFSVPPVDFTFANFSSPVTLAGSGFAPNEIVTYWVEPPHGGCPSMTAHYAWKDGLIIYGVIALRQEWQENLPVFDSYGAQFFSNAKADGGGNAATTALFTALACEGQWHFVARGNASGRGADTVITVTGNSVSTNAWLIGDKETVTGIADTIHFTGSGFGINETLSCWLTSPRGQAIGYPVPESVTLTLVVPGVGEQYHRDDRIRSDGNGNTAFRLFTGSAFLDAVQHATVGGGTIQDELHLSAPIQSEGALGEWAMSCRGDQSTATAIARFTVAGGIVDP